MATKIELYNQALGHIVTERLHPTNGLTEDRKERHELDAVYDKSRAWMLEQGLWKFALRSSQLDYDPNVDTSFGLEYAFAQPTDFVRLANIASDPYFRSEVEDYVEENGVWYSDLQTLYIRYVSSHADYGGDIGLFPENYCVALTADMALRSSLQITKDRVSRNDLMLDALDERVKRKPPGRWPMVRGRSSSPRFSNGKIRL
jgi:hypothetical protein